MNTGFFACLCAIKGYRGTGSARPQVPSPLQALKALQRGGKP